MTWMKTTQNGFHPTDPFWLIVAMLTTSNYRLEPTETTAGEIEQPIENDSGVETRMSVLGYLLAAFRATFCIVLRSLFLGRRCLLETPQSRVCTSGAVRSPPPLHPRDTLPSFSCSVVFVSQALVYGLSRTDSFLCPVSFESNVVLCCFAVAMLITNKHICAIAFYSFHYLQ